MPTGPASPFIRRETAILLFYKTERLIIFETDDFKGKLHSCANIKKLISTPHCLLGLVDPLDLLHL